MNRALKRVLLGVLLAGVTMALISALKGLSYNTYCIVITDALSLPGGLVARIFYPAGVHTGYGAPNWGYVAAWSNVVFYIALWYVILWLLRFPRKTPHP